MFPSTVQEWIRDGMPGRPRTRAQHAATKQLMVRRPNFGQLDAEYMFAHDSFYGIDEDGEIKEIMEMTGVSREAAQKLFDDDDQNEIVRLRMLHLNVPPETIALVERCCADDRFDAIDVLLMAIDLANGTGAHVDDVLRAIEVFDKTENSSCTLAAESLAALRQAGFPEPLVQAVFEELRC